MALNLPNFFNVPTPEVPDAQKMMGTELDNAFKRVQNKYAEPEAIAKIGLHGAQSQEAQAKAQKAQQMAHILQAFSQAAGISPMQNQGVGNNNQMPMQQNQEMGMQGGGQSMQQGVGQLQQVQGRAGMSPLMENLGISMMGGRPLAPYTNAENQHVQPSYFGPETVLGQARPPEDIKGAETRAAKMAETNVEAIKQNYQTYTQAINAKPSIQGMVKMLEDPELSKVVGPFWKDKAAKYLGSDRAKELQATFNTLGKNVVTETAQAFGTRFTNQEMKWLQDILPNASDTLPAIKGKVRTLEMLRQANEQKAVMKDQLMREHNIDPIMADQMADSQVDLDAIKREIKPTISFKNAEGLIEDVPKSDTKYIEQLRKAGYEEGDF